MDATEGSKLIGDMLERMVECDQVEFEIEFVKFCPLHSNRTIAPVFFNVAICANKPVNPIL